MADPIHVTAFSRDGASGVDQAFDHGQDFTPGSSVLVEFACFTGTDGTQGVAVDVNGVAAVRDNITPGTITGGSFTEQWRAIDVPGGGATVTITLESGVTVYLVGSIREYAGALDLIAIGAQAWHFGPNPDVTTANVGAESPEVGDIVSALIGTAATGVAPGYSEGFDSVALSAGKSGQGIYRDVDTPGNQTANFLTSGGNCDVLAAVYRQSAPAANPRRGLAGAFLQ